MEQRRPESEGLLRESLYGIALSVVVAFAALSAGMSIVASAFLCLATYAAPQIVSAFRARRSEITKALNLRLEGIVCRKVAAVGVALAFVLAWYGFASLLGFARFGTAGALLLNAAPALLLISIPYVCTVNRIQADPHDEYFEVGSLLLGQVKGRDWHKVRHFFLSWFIKGFFAALMLWELFGALSYLQRGLLSSPGESTGAYDLTLSTIYFVDVVVATAGYFATLRLFGWQIRSVNPSFWGWLVTLICYYPFFGFVYRALLDYKSGEIWSDWFAGNPLLLAAWGAAILILKLTWILSIASFGLRFSNLTNRGIITDGAYRLTKHPSYISKNLFWWLINMPFLSSLGAGNAALNCLQLLAINGIYFAGAKYEEIHLREEPNYVAYSRWVVRHGLFARLRRLVPPLRRPRRRLPL